MGDLAPDFKIKTLDSKRTVRLHFYRGQQPVVPISKWHAKFLPRT